MAQDRGRVEEIREHPTNRDTDGLRMATRRATSQTLGAAEQRRDVVRLASVQRCEMDAADFTADSARAQTLWKVSSASGEP